MGIVDVQAESERPCADPDVRKPRARGAVGRLRPLGRAEGRAESQLSDGR